MSHGHGSATAAPRLGTGPRARTATRHVVGGFGAGGDPVDGSARRTVGAAGGRRGDVVTSTVGATDRGDARQRIVADGRSGRPGRRRSPTRARCGRPRRPGHRRRRDHRRRRWPRWRGARSPSRRSGGAAWRPVRGDGVGPLVTPAWSHTDGRAGVGAPHPLLGGAPAAPARQAHELLAAWRSTRKPNGDRDDRRDGVAGPGEPAPQRRLGPVHPRPGVVLRDAELLRDLGIREAVHLVEPERLTLRGGQRVERGLHRAEHHRIGGVLGDVGRDGVARADPLGQRALHLTARRVVGAHVGEDAAQPRADAVLAVDPAQAAVGPLERLLDRVLRLDAAAETTVRLREQPR